jgi:sugar lactone lactonase YvrE
MKHLITSALWLSLTITSLVNAAPETGSLETVAELPIRPGNVSVTTEGRIFATVHPLDTPSGLQLIEVDRKTGDYKAWPSKDLQKTAAATSAQFDSLLGITQDKAGHLWTVDMGLELGQTRIWGFIIDNGKLYKQLVLPEELAPKGSFIQDLVVDSTAGWIYLADIANPGLLAVRIRDGHAVRFSDHASLQAQADAVMKVDGQVTLFNGKAAQVAVNPLSLSADGETLYYGAMNGTHWYQLSTEALQTGKADHIAATVKLVGNKPVSDGATTSAQGQHYFTNLNQNAIDLLDRKNQLKTLVSSPLLDWPDSVQFGESGWLYISVNQLHKAKAFNGQAETAQVPYRIMRVWTGEDGVRR